MSGGLETIWQGVKSGFNVLSDQAFFGSAAFLLALVFAISAVPKLRKPELAGMAIADFGVTERPHRSAGLALGAGELTLAAALAAAAGAGGDAKAIPMALAALLLWTFVGLIGRALRSPERFSCFCFGSTEDSISTRTLARSGALALLATVAAAVAQSSMTAPDLQEWMLEFVIAASILGLGTLAISARAIVEAAR